jgi:hypothetical protein
MSDEQWVNEQKAAMERIAPLFDQLEAAVNKVGPLDLVGAYIVALRAIREVDLDKPMLEKFVAVLLADRTYQVVGEPTPP